MLPSFVLAMREGLEIALIVGILFGALHKINRPELTRTLVWGVVAAMALSLGIATLLSLMGASLEGDFEPIYEGVMMWIAAGMLTWMFLWMRSRAGDMKNMISQEVRSASGAGKAALFLVAFVSVLREGIELGLFLTASTFSSTAGQTVLGAALGIGVAVILGFGLFRASLKLNLKMFFSVTGIFLLLFAAGLVAHGTHEFNEVGIIPPVVEDIWNTSSLLNEDSVAGQVLKALFGYNANPSLTEALSYVLYYGVVYVATLPTKISLAAKKQAA